MPLQRSSSVYLTGLEEKQKPCKHSYVVKQEVDLLLFQCAMQAGRLRLGNIFFVFMAPSSWYVYVSDNRVKLMYKILAADQSGDVYSRQVQVHLGQHFFFQKKEVGLEPTTLRSLDKRSTTLATSAWFEVCLCVDSNPYQLSCPGSSVGRALDCRVSWVRIPPRATLVFSFEEKSCPGCSLLVCLALPFYLATKLLRHELTGLISSHSDSI